MFANFASHIAAALNAESATRGTPSPMAPFGDALRLQYPDGAVSSVTYNERAMRWEHKARG